MLPQKTFYQKTCTLFESDFDVTSHIKLRRVMELMQDAATAHAEKLGIGWDNMDRSGLFWIMSKAKVVFVRQINRKIQSFKLYTWPVAPDRLYLERRFEAVDEQGNLLFSASTMWLIVERDSRKICSRDVVAQYYNFDFDGAECNCGNVFDRVRADGSYSLCYQSAVRRSDLDLNGHVNNTRYVDYALDVLDENTSVQSFEIVFSKELKLGDTVDVLCRKTDGVLYVAGMRGTETCFTVKMITSDK